MRSKELLNKTDRALHINFRQAGKSTLIQIKLYDALMLAEAEIEELRQKLHIANTEIDALNGIINEYTDLKSNK